MTMTSALKKMNKRKDNKEKELMELDYFCNCTYIDVNGPYRKLKLVDKYNFGSKTILLKWLLLKKKKK